MRTVFLQAGALQQYRDSVQAFVDGIVAGLPQVIAGAIVFAIAYLLSAVARRSAARALTQATKDERAGEAWGTIVKYLVILLGVVAGLAAAGVDLSAMMVAVGAVGFGLAFAMQDTIANFIAGLILLSTHPFARGDRVEVAGESGTVQEVGMRSTQMKTFEGLRVEVPNRNIISSNITVFNYHPSRRVEVGVGIGYDDDIPGAIDTIREAVEGVGGVLDDPAPEVLITELGGSSVNLTIRFWVDTVNPPSSWLQTKTEVTRRAKEALDAGGYDIPYPIRTVFLNEEQAGADEA